MKEKKGELIASIIILIIVAVIVIPIIISKTIEHKQILKSTEIEQKLIEEGKIVSADTIINEVVEIFKNREEEKIKTYISDNFKYIGSDRYESKYINNLWSQLKYLVTNYDIEKRGNSIENQETYIVYWNTNEKAEGRTDKFYCLQKILIYLEKVVEENQITYKINQITLTNEYM